MGDQKTEPDRTEIGTIINELKKKKYKRKRKRLRDMHPAKMASLLETLETSQRAAMREQIDDGRTREILRHTPGMREGLPAGDAVVDDEENPARTELERLRGSLDRGKLQASGRLLTGMHPAKAAGLLESLPPRERSTAWNMVKTDVAGPILRHLHDEVRMLLALEMEPEDLAAAAGTLELDDLVDLIQDLPAENRSGLLRDRDEQERRRVESLLTYEEDSAGGLTNTDQIAVRTDLRLRSVLRYLRVLDDLPDNTDKLMVVDDQGRYLEVLRARHLLTGTPDERVEDLMEESFAALPVDMHSHDVARRFEEHDLVSAPVVGADNLLLGRITVADVVDVIRGELERSLMHMAGMEEDEDMFAPVLTSSRRRAVWLGINLITAFLAAWVIGLFEGTLEKVVALAVLMPIVASMGGIAGTQTLTLVIRGLALGHLERGDTSTLLMKELAAAMWNGLGWAIIVAVLAVAWFGDWLIGSIIAAAILLNILCAALAGVLIPIFLRSLGVVPVLAGGVILTTVTDVVGFFSVSRPRHADPVMTSKAVPWP